MILIYKLAFLVLNIFSVIKSENRQPISLKLLSMIYYKIIQTNDS